eukprot:1181735-Prorocentrum_minimum.AAC.1
MAMRVGGRFSSEGASPPVSPRPSVAKVASRKQVQCVDKILAKAASDNGRSNSAGDSGSSAVANKSHVGRRDSADEVRP